MLFSTVLDYSCGRLVHLYKLQENTKKAKLWLMVSITINLGMLSFFKYSDFFIANINNLLNLSIPLLKLTLPIGISISNNVLYHRCI